MNPRKCITIVTLLLLVVCAKGQETSRFTGSLLWEISGNNLKESSYILGTHHIIDKSILDSIPHLEQIFKKVEQMVGEIDLTDETELKNKISSSVMLPTEESYRTILSTTDYEKLDKNLTDNLGMGLEQLGQFRPGMISSIFTAYLYAKIDPSFNLADHEAIDSYLQKIASEANKSIIGLENVDDQIDILFFGSSQQAEALVCMTDEKSVKYQEKSIRQLNTNYRLGKLDSLYSQSFQDPNEPCPYSQDIVGY